MGAIVSTGAGRGAGGGGRMTGEGTALTEESDGKYDDLTAGL